MDFETLEVAKDSYIYVIEDEQDQPDEELLYSRYQHEQERNLFEVYHDAVSPFQLSEEEITKLGIVKSEDTELGEPQNEKPCMIPSASLSILKNYVTRFKQSESNETNARKNDTKLSTDAVIRLAAESFIQSGSDASDNFSSVLSHPFAFSFLGLSAEETKDVELVQDLLASAEKVGYQQYHRARKLLRQCKKICSSEGNSVQRLFYYFSRALHQKISKVTGNKKLNDFRKQQLLDLEDIVSSPSPTNIAFHQKVPFYQISQYTGMQVIFESVSDAKKIHIIDLVVMKGAHIVVLMQALADRSENPVEHLKISAVGNKSEKNFMETGERLTGFAQSLNLSFSFDVIVVKDILDLKLDLFKFESEERVAVHSSYLLSSMICQPDKLEFLMRVIRNINPHVMVITEVEANLNSPNFFTRFIEALFFYGSVFDSLEDCMGGGDPNRTKSELLYLSAPIENIVAAEGAERSVRHVKIGVWRKFFARFGMKEQELSMSSLYQASLIVKKFECESSCTLGMNDNCLLIGWKGTPLQSLSAWKFL